MATLLLIGGTGFFGKSFLDAFRRGLLDNWGIKKVISMSRDAECLRILAPDLVTERVELVSGNIGMVTSIPSADYVVHAAASTNANDYLLSGNNERKNIESAVLNYCRLATKFHSKSKTVYVSSGAAYGLQPVHIPFLIEDKHSFPLSNLPKNKFDYALAKLEAENEFKTLGRNGINSNIARCFTFVGSWLPLNQHFAIGNFLRDGLEKKCIKVNSMTPVMRSYMHADDMVRWIMTIADNASTECDIYNVGSDEAITLTNLARLIATKFDTDVDSNCNETSEVSDIYVPSIEKATQKLGLSVKYNISDALDITIEKLKQLKFNGIKNE